MNKEEKLWSRLAALVLERCQFVGMDLEEARKLVEASGFRVGVKAVTRGSQASLDEAPQDPRPNVIRLYFYEGEFYATGTKVLKATHG